MGPNRDHPTDPPQPPANPPRRKKFGWGWLVAVTLVALAWAGAFALRGGGEEVQLEGWAHGLEEGQAQAKAQDKPMLVMFTATWCGPCQVMKQNVLTRPAVDEALKAGFVPVKVDMSNAGPGDALVQQYGLSGWPTLIAMSPEGEEIKRIEGLAGPAKSPDTFIDWLDAIEE